MEVPPGVTCVGTESRMGVARGWGRKNVRYSSTGTEFRFCKMKTVLQMDGSDKLHNYVNVH